MFFSVESMKLFSIFFPGKENEGNVVDFYRLDEIAAEPFENSPPLPPATLPLAAERTRRKDPLDGFNKYTNGWNISDHHYWAVSPPHTVTHFKFSRTLNY